MRTRTTLATFALIALAALAGCGSDSDDTEGGGSSEKVLTKAQAKSALLTADDLGTGFRVDDSEDSDDTSLGCLDDFDDVDKVADAATDVEAKYEADTDFGLPGVMSSVGSFESSTVAKKNFAEIRRVLDSCTSIDETDEDGAHFKLTVSYDQEKADDDIDEQLNVKAAGSIEVQGITVPMVVHIAIARIDNDGVMAGFFTAAEDASAEADKVVDAALARFVPVAQGQDPVTPEPLDLEPVDPSTLMKGAA